MLVEHGIKPDQYKSLLERDAGESKKADRED